MKIKEIWYDEEADVLDIEVSNNKYWKSIELPNGVVVNISKDGSITSVEILNASNYFYGDARKVIDIAKPVSKH